MVKEAISQIIHSIRLHWRRMLWVFRKTQHKPGDPKLSATTHSPKLPKQSILRNSARGLLIAIAGLTLLSACCTLGTRGSKGTIGPATQVLETKVVVRGKGDPQWHNFHFKVCETGSGMLRLTNGAKSGSSPQELVQGAMVTLNDEVVITPKEFNQRTDVLEIPVGLKCGANKLGVKLRSDPGKRLSVRIVTPAHAAQPKLIIYGPATVPPAIPPSKNPVPVTFRAFVATTTPPKVLFLHKVNEDGELINPPAAELRDNGKNGDSRPGDFIYAVNLDVSSRKETTKRYRVRAEIFGKNVLSSIIYDFHVTTLPIGIRPSDQSKLVKDPKSNFRIFSNEVAVGIRPGVRLDRDRIEVIAKAAGGSVVGFIPPLRLFQLEIQGDDTADAVYHAIDVISKFKKEVAYAEPNHETLPASSHAFPDIMPGEIAVPGPGHCDPDTEPNCQWYLTKINAIKAWKIARGGGVAIQVAVIDSKAIIDQNGTPVIVNGLIDFSHEDLVGEVDNDLPVSTDSTLHATRIGGIIAAMANNLTNSIAGIAWYNLDGTARYSLLRSYTNSGAVELANEILDARSDGAQIINISQQFGNVTYLKCALEYVISGVDSTGEGCLMSPGGALVVTAAGNGPTGSCNSKIWPSGFNTNDDGLHTLNPNLSHGLLAVGATDQNDGDSPWGGVFPCGIQGPWLDLYAPGHDIYSTTIGNTYALDSGTSYSTAVVSGAAAVLWADNLGWTAQQVHDRLIQTATKVTAQDPEPCADGNQCGRLDLFAAVNKAPTDISLSTDNINENIDTTSGSLVGTLSTSDPNMGDTHIYEIVGGIDSILFEIPQMSNRLILWDGILDFETKNSYTVNVQTTDSGGQTFVQTLTILVNDLNEVLFFDGTNDFVNIPYNSNLDLQELTVEAWILIDDGDYPNFFRRPILSKGVGFGNYTLGVLGDDTFAVPGSLEYVHRVATGNFSCCAPAHITPGTWTHFAATYSDAAGGLTTVYVNGQLVRSLVSQQSPLQNSDPLFLGRAVFQSVADQFYKGYIDEVRIWNRARTLAEIQAYYQQQIDPIPAELIGYWKFEGDGQTVRDSAGSNHGYLGADMSVASDDPTRGSTTELTLN